MSITRADIEGFFRTLLLGDFEEQQNTSAQLIGGLISLIPVLDQVMDVRDVSGSLYRIQNAGGFKAASTDQTVNFGFAAFGVIPEVGSAFKTVFKPLWKERRAAKGAVHSGVTAIEQLLHMRKGGAIAWVREQLLGKWAARTQQAVALANQSLDATIELTEFIASASGWKDWLVPDSAQRLAREQLPGLKSMRGQLGAPIQRASAEIEAFLEDLLGEQAAAVAMAVGQRVAAGSAMPGSRAKTGHNKADLKPQGRETSRHKDEKVGGKPKADASHGAGNSHNRLQNTAAAVADKLTNELVGISGEHIADYHCAKTFGWGGHWHEHDKGAEGSWTIQPDARNVGKLSHGGAPKSPHVLYKLTDGANGTGIDAVWRAEGHNEGKPYAIVEAKASRDEDAPKFMRKPGNTRKPSVASMLGMAGKPDGKELLEPLEEGAASAKPKKPSGKAGGKATSTSGSSKPAVPKNQSAAKVAESKAEESTAQGKKEILVQMSHEWIASNIRKAVSDSIADEISLRRQKVYSRHLFFAPAYHDSGSPLAHMKAKLEGLPPSQHESHDAFHYDESSVKKAVNKRKAALRKKYGNLPSLKEEA